MKCRIFYKDSVVYAVNVPAPKYQDDIDSCKIPEGLASCSVMVTDLDAIPAREHTAQLYMESDVLKSDTAWEKTLMPDSIVKMKHVANAESQLDAGLALPSPDPIAMLKLQRDAEISKKEEASDTNDSLYWANKALEGLDRAETDKPAIRTKIEANIAKLT